MAEPMQILAATTSVISLALQINRRLIQITRITSRGDDQIEFLELSNEVKSYAALLQAIHRLLEQRHHAPELETLEPELELASRSFQAAERMLRVDGVKRFKWAQRKNDISRIKSDLRARTTTLGLLLSLVQMSMTHDFREPSGNLEVDAQQAEILIAVLGPTGAGKSRFIQEITGSPGAVVGSGLTSVTETVSSHSIALNGRIITLIDTPGFDDTFKGDAEVLTEVAEFLAVSYRLEQRLTGVIYIQPITMTRFTGTMVKNLKVFEKMVGVDNYGNVILVTSRWDQLASLEEGISRERELCHGFWAPLIEKGSLTSRFFGNKSSATRTVGLMAFDRRFSLKPPLTIQTEMVDEQKSLAQTAAGLELRQEMSNMQRKHEEEIAKVQAHAEQDAARMREMREELDNIRAEQALLKDALTSKEERQKIDARIRVEWDQRTETLLNPEAQIISRNIRDAPPPYEEQVGRQTVNWWGKLLPIAIWAREEFYRAMRPKLEEGWTRLEWTCSCGDLLYGDFEPGAPESLKDLANRLGAVVLAGPVSSSNSTSEPGAPGLPPPAFLPGLVSSSHQAGGSGVGGATTGDSSSQPPVHSTSGATMPSIPLPRTVKKKYLELCTHASDGFHRLGEIDVGSSQSMPLSDRATFERIRAQYEKDRTIVRLFEYFAVHTPVSGIFVQFLTDRRPLVAVEKSGSQVPPAEEVNNGRYIYHPVPMNGPPIPKKVFMHYFTKTTSAHNEAIWVTRFPHKLGDSIFYQSKPLTVGWGVEIEEVRNWWLLCTAQLIILLLNGGVTAIYATVQKDVASGIAIGAWLTAVQSLAIIMLFFRWA